MAEGSEKKATAMELTEEGNAGGGTSIAQGPNYRPYPLPFGSYSDVIADKKLFMLSLEKLHHKMGTKFMIPTVGGKELDLHLLFKEVTSRGGIDKVIKDRRWKEITNVFNFPSTATNASYVLRKYYLSLLHHYEQIYFFKAQGWEPNSDTPRKRKSSLSVGGNLIYCSVPFVNLHFGLYHIAQCLPTGDHAESFTIHGVIDGKFEHGYLTTVFVSGKRMQGVLYHVPNGGSPRQTEQQQQTGKQTEQPPEAAAATNARVDTCAVRVRRRRKKKLSKLDPTHPKPNRSGYNFFFAEKHFELKPLYPGRDREISRMIGDLWNKLPANEKAVYQEIGLRDKERYQGEMVVYREKQRSAEYAAALKSPLPIRQIPRDSSLKIPGAANLGGDDEDRKQKVVVVEGGVIINSLSSSHDSDGSGSSISESDSEQEPDC